MVSTGKGLSLLVFTVLAAGVAMAEPLNDAQRQKLRAMQTSYRYTAIVRAYADYMIEHGRDRYGKKHTPLFVTGMDRRTGRRIRPPFPHVKRRPFMPGWERDRECRGSDRNYGQADPLDQLTLLKLMHKLTEITGDKRYADQADKTASWWMANTQTKIGLYVWGTHTSWNVDREAGGGTFEFNHVWPYWKLNPEALQRYAMGLWNHYVRDKKTGDFNRHAHTSKHGPGGGMEFPWPGSAMIATWVEAYLAKPNPEYVRAIDTILNRWESLRDKNGHLAPCSNYKEWAWYSGYVVAANRLDDWADRIQEKEPKLAEKMRAYGRKCDAAYLKLADNLLDIKRVGPVKSYLRATGEYNPERLDILGGPWYDRKDYARFGVKLYERARRNPSEALRKRYHRAVLDTAEVYMSINPEVQWSVWGVNMSNAIQVMFAAHDLTGNAAYLHRADHLGRLAVDLFLDEASPLPKITSHDDFYEIESVTHPSSDVWMLTVLELTQRLAKLEAPLKHPARIATGRELTALGKATLLGAPAGPWQAQMTKALAEHRGGLWDCAALSKPAASVALGYGKDGKKTLFLSRRKEGFSSTRGLPVDSLELIASDFINKIPTLAEAKPFNGRYRRNFSGKHREPSTATYGGFKDVLDQVGLLLVNRGKQAAKVTVTATLHDSWDDRDTKAYTVTLQPGKRVLVACAAPEKRFIRRLDLRSDTANAVKLEQFAFAMAPRSKLNPLTPGSSQAPKGPPFGGAKPKLVTDGLVLHLAGEALKSLADGSRVGTWASQVTPKLVATAEGDRRPVLAREGGRTVLRFDGKDDFLTIADHDALDLEAWTLIVVARPRRGPGVVLGKVDGRIAMMNYRLQVEKDGSVGAAVRGPSARHQVNRLASARTLNRFAVIAARFNPALSGTKRISISVDGAGATRYSYENAEGALTTFTHDCPLEIGRQPGREPRYFQGDIAEILLYNRAVTDAEQNSAARWLFARAPDGKTAAAGNATGPSGAASSRDALVFLIAGQSNAGGVAAFSPETNAKAGMQKKHPTIPGSTAKEVGIPTAMEAYPRCHIWKPSSGPFERLTPGKNLQTCYRDPWRHGMELPMAMLLEKQYPDADKFFVKHGPGGHNLHTQWKAEKGPDYKTFIAQCSGAMAHLKTRYKKVRMLGLYWDQGESDQPQALQYEENLRNLFLALRTDTGLPDLRIYVRKHLFQHGRPDFKPIIDAQVKVTKNDPNAHLLDLDLGSNEKNFKAWAWTDNNGHLSSKAYLELSKRVCGILQAARSVNGLRARRQDGPQDATRNPARLRRSHRGGRERVPQYDRRTTVLLRRKGT